jgi:hypothetical protein
VRCLHQWLGFQFISLCIIGYESLCPEVIMSLTSRFARRIVTFGQNVWFVIQCAEPHPVHAGTGLGAVLPSGFARNSRRTPRPSSASTTASRSPSPTKTGLRAREVARLKLSTPSVSSERGNGCPPLPKVRVFRWTLPHSGLKMGTSVSGVPDIENA